MFSTAAADRRLMRNEPRVQKEFHEEKYDVVVALSDLQVCIGQGNIDCGFIACQQVPKIINIITHICQSGPVTEACPGTIRPRCASENLLLELFANISASQ
jgi:hypothetical protein